MMDTKERLLQVLYCDGPQLSTASGCCWPQWLQTA